MGQSLKCPHCDLTYRERIAEVKVSSCPRCGELVRNAGRDITPRMVLISIGQMVAARMQINLDRPKNTRKGDTWHRDQYRDLYAHMRAEGQEFLHALLFEDYDRAEDELADLLALGSMMLHKKKREDLETRISHKRLKEG